MKTTILFPCILMLLDIGAGIMWAINGDIRKFVYWIAAAVLTATVTF